MAIRYGQRNNVKTLLNLAAADTTQDSLIDYLLEDVNDQFHELLRQAGTTPPLTGAQISDEVQNIEEQWAAALVEYHRTQLGFAPTGGAPPATQHPKVAAAREPEPPFGANQTCGLCSVYCHPAKNDSLCAWRTLLLELTLAG